MLRYSFPLLALVCILSNPSLAQAPNPNATLSDFSTSTRSDIVPPAADIAPPTGFTLTAIPPFMAPVQPTGISPSAANVTGNSLAGFFFSSEQTQQVVQVAEWLSNSISARQFPDPLLESLKALSMVVMNGAMSGQKLSGALSTLPNGEKANMTINWDPKAVITPEVAFATAADRFNQMVQRSVASNPEALNDRNISAVRDWLALMNSGFRSNASKN